MKKFIQETPHLAAGLIAFLLGLLLMVPAYLCISYWEAPRPASVGTWEDFSEAQKKGLVEAIRVYEDQKMFQYSTGSERWVSVPKAGHIMRDYPGVVYPKEQKAKLTIAAAIAFLVVCPFLAMSSKVQQYATPGPQKSAPAVASGSSQQPLQKPTHIQQPPRQEQQMPTQKPPRRPPVEEEPQEEVDITAASRMKVSAFEDKSITFDDIAGYETTKKNMEFIVHCLTHPELLKQTGAKVPSGILLYGPPGTGKTLMARAIAGSAGVGFFSGNASDFVNKWVGVGADNVRALYREARAHAPSVVFIDEIDAVGGQRTGEMNDEHRQTLNALLAEMDGINKETGVLTIAATNSFESLDSALVRAGRFDRKIMIPLPSYEDRLAIIKLYAQRRNMSPDISLEKLAKDTVGLSGSEINTLFNEASLRAVQNNRGIVLAEDVDEALTQMLTNGESLKATNKKDLEIAAYHEAGHTVILKLLAHRSVPKVTIIGSTAGYVGLTRQSEEEERKLMPVQQIRALIVAAYGGRAAEELIFGRDAVTTGARQDIQHASSLIREYLQHGAGSTLLDMEAFSGRQGVLDNAAEAKALSSELYAQAVSFLTEHRGALERVAMALLEKDTLMEDELSQLLL